ncbi:zinc-binding alcohol dehydrogenase family protein [Aspergillus ibericus CBS 121593]|uniref:Alcohol dehydrogenase n=1 Tax=Aspergillus ibericus CBS 121593 TaxID=1448316 RepID=A0A395H6U0_9EURO|nr:alcohol dehydrogenase [Aspergillus ibericus CBS 121593]RAL02588.1 alcohol dehydrogenase [Aspergillus ibericus CBS 121593]
MVARLRTQTAVVTQGPNKAGFVTDRPIPRLRDEYILVKTVTVALNPTDWKHIDFVPSNGCTVGCDFAGVVEAVGRKMTEFQVGDRVLGISHGCNAVEPDDGSFCEYILTKPNGLLKVPEGMSWEDACTVGVGYATVGQSLYQNLGLPMPGKPRGPSTPKTILIYGGSTATGTLAIQCAKLSGMEVITTCSASNFDFVKELGADVVFDYTKPNAAAEIRKYTRDGLKLCFDTVAMAVSAQFCAEALTSKAGGRYHTLQELRSPRRDVRSTVSMAYTVAGDAYTMGPQKVPAKPNDVKHHYMWKSIFQELLHQGKIKTHPVSKQPYGLKGTLNGLDLLRENQVRGQKLVYRVDETPHQF